ncbi:hypothetical protein [Kocuria sp. NPDC057446]|uniref:hypothetical protein n=1 Tax=Kocuria sp. NPDC057446 TaxID=3346137 RepID=UPI00369B7586
MDPRARRLARGWAGAGIATSAAVLSHAAADGQAPPAVLVLLSLALSGPLCIALAGRVLSRSSLLLGVLLSQSVLHALFAASGGAGAVSRATSSSLHHAAQHGAAAGPYGAGPALVLEVQTHAEHGGTAMVVAHVLAALAAYVLMRHGEVAAVVLLEALRLRVRRRRPVRPSPVVAHRPRSVQAGRPHVLTDQALLRPVRSHRGPPRPRRRPLPPVLHPGPATLPAG